MTPSEVVAAAAAAAFSLSSFSPTFFFSFSFFPSSSLLPTRTSAAASRIRSFPRPMWTVAGPQRSRAVNGTEIGGGNETTEEDGEAGAAAVAVAVSVAVAAAAAAATAEASSSTNEEMPSCSESDSEEEEEEEEGELERLFAPPPLPPPLPLPLPPPRPLVVVLVALLLVLLKSSASKSSSSSPSPASSSGIEASPLHSSSLPKWGTSVPSSIPASSSQPWTATSNFENNKIRHSFSEATIWSAEKSVWPPRDAGRRRETGPARGVGARRTPETEMQPGKEREREIVK